MHRLRLVLVLAAMLAVASAVTWQRIRVADAVGDLSFPARSHHALSPFRWTQSFNYMLSYGITDTAVTPHDHFSFVYLRKGLVLRKFDNTTLEFAQLGVEVANHGKIDLPDQGTLPISHRIRGHKAVTWLNTTRTSNSEFNTNDQPNTFLYSGFNPPTNTYSELALNLRFALNAAANPPTSDPSFSLSAGGTAGAFAWEGMTAAVQTSALAVGTFARAIFFGGVKGSNYTNGLFYIDFRSSGISPAFALSPAAGVPSPRAYHDTVAYEEASVIVSGNRFMLVWGGTDGISYFNDGPFVYDMIDDTWSLHSPSSRPPARAGHTLTMLQDNNVFYLFGGKDATRYFNDFWEYRIDTQEWTQLFNGGGEPLPTARAFHSAAALDNVTIVFFGGESANGPLNDWITVDISVTCPYFCHHPGDKGALGACMSYEQCHFIKECHAPTPFQCNLECLADPSDCVPNPTCGADEVPCWHGLCVPTGNITACKPYHACPFGYKRCNNGNCRPESDPCPTGVECPVDTELCADGSCRPQCFGYYGCLPNDKPVQCADGTCAATWDDCNKNCTGSEIKCWHDCKETCTQAYWTDDTHFIAFTQPTRDFYFLYRKEGHIEIDDTRGVVNLEVTNTTNRALVAEELEKYYKNITFFVRSAYESDLRDIGPHPTWPSEFESGYIRSLAIRASTDGLSKAYGVGAPAVSVMLRYAFDEVELDYIESDLEGNTSTTLKYIVAHSCFAIAKPWFWDDEFDLDPDFPMANISYFALYRQQQAALKKNGTYSGPLPEPPLYRWQCQIARENFWPRFLLYPPDTYKLPDDIYLGIRLENDTNDEVMALIYAPYGFDPLPPQGATLLPADPVANYVALVLGVACAILLVLIIVVTVKALLARS